MPSSKLLSGLASIKKICGTNSLDELIINTDSRSFKKGETFVALEGENFDGFNYVKSVLELGASAVAFTDNPNREEEVKKLVEQYPKTQFIYTTSSLAFLQELASEHIKAWKAKNLERKIIGITGSNGKTTHKEMVYYLLHSLFGEKVLATKGNLNNHIGVPLTLFRLTDQHEVAIIEMGMNHPGEIAELCSIAHPEHGMITNIGPAHIEFMKSIENIFLEKSSLYKSVLENSKGLGAFVVNADDHFLSQLEKSSGLSTYGEKNGDVLVKIIGAEIGFTFNGKPLLITNKNILEHHNLKNLAGTTLLSLKLFPHRADEIVAAASRYEQPNMNRSQWIDHIFLDAYNANPSSMKVSLDSFISVMKNRSINLNDCFFVLGDMNELGDFARDLHVEIAKHLKQSNIENVCFIGRYKEFYLEGFGPTAKSYLKKEDFYEEWKSIRKKYKYVFIKASRSLQLETLMSIV
jgi:UDP-N-acetylmuramoyl-tripeptide--D-alanyl-D-alanine ligase